MTLNRATTGILLSMVAVAAVAGWIIANRQAYRANRVFNLLVPTDLRDGIEQGREMALLELTLPADRALRIRERMDPLRVLRGICTRVAGETDSTQLAEIERIQHAIDANAGSRLRSLPPSPLESKSIQSADFCRRLRGDAEELWDSAARVESALFWRMRARWRVASALRDRSLRGVPPSPGFQRTASAEAALDVATCRTAFRASADPAGRALLASLSEQVTRAPYVAFLKSVETAFGQEVEAAAESLGD
jgi:hypothetical protein